ncbi:molybdopterin molybdotransferase MoeA [Candidatus Acetothermia bacterium]|nr:molybdopterin molybdotransferase MoeA [Candidatus Acetothermia bacterium]MBI3644158.1 molybdopterin molybdotransferase MoeA [Candidatus Acetothermia bacterium]
MISVQEAWELYASFISALPSSKVPLKEALGRVLAQDATSKIDLPPFPQSAMDGYALRAEDVEVASEKITVKLRIVGEVPAGGLGKIPGIGSGETMRIFTGAHIPEGTTAVLRQEDARVEGHFLIISRPIPLHENMRHRGEEILVGGPLAKAGTRVTPGLLTVLSIAGVDSVKVIREPRITVLTTGDEVVKPGKRLRPGEVYDGDEILTNSWLKNLGYSQVETYPVLDSLEATAGAMSDALKSSDLVLTCGGISVGDRDFILRATQKLRVKEIFWQVRQRPGKPLYFGMRGKKIVLGIPGNPGSVFVCLNLHAIRVLDLLERDAHPRPCPVIGRISQAVKQSPDREFFMRSSTSISESGEIWLNPLPNQSSHMITNFAECNALARIAEGNAVIKRGSRVNWVSC